MTTLYLMRHGATAANLQQPYTLQGSQPDAELDPVGVTQAVAAATAFAHMPIDVVYSSPMKRAMTTAEQLGRAVVIAPDLIEVDVGEWAGLTWGEIAARWPDQHAAFHATPEQCGYLGGENLLQVAARVVPAIDLIVAKHPGQVLLVVSHGVVNRVLLAHWLGMPLHFARRLPQDNTGYNRIDFHDGVAKVRMINSITHLAG